jgi:hypothetical protein
MEFLLGDFLPVTIAIVLQALASSLQTWLLKTDKHAVDLAWRIGAFGSCLAFVVLGLFLFGLGYLFWIVGFAVILGGVGVVLANMIETTIRPTKS